MVTLIRPQRIFDIGADEHKALEGEIGAKDTEDIAGAEDDDMLEFGPVVGANAHKADARRGRVVMRLGTEAEWEELVRLAADEEVPPIPEVPEEFGSPPRERQTNQTSSQARGAH